MHHDLQQAGLSIIGLVFGVAIGGLIVVGISLFVGRGFTTNREQLAQVLATEEARLQSQRIGDAIRNGRNVSSDEPWLISANEYEIRLYTNIDNDLDPEDVRYFIEGSTLMRAVTENGEEEVDILARTIRNLEEKSPLFAYYDAAGNEVPLDQVTAGSVQSVLIRLVTDVDPNKLPVQETVETVVLVRGVLDRGILPPVDLLPVTLDFPANLDGTDEVEVTVFDPGTGTPISQEVIPIVDINDGRLRVFDGGYYTHINYLPNTVGGYPPGWYAWIGPILVGRSGTAEYTITEQLTISELCTGAELSELLLTCSPRTVSVGSFSTDYQPIITYTIPEGAEHYVETITFTHIP